VEVDPEDLALLESLGNGDISVGVMEMLRTLDALPADVRAALEAEVRAQDVEHTDPDEPADDADMGD
jgi:hypothetical protein